MGLTSTVPIVHRPTLVNEDSARDLVRAWGIDKMHDVTVMDVYSGERLFAHLAALTDAD